MMKYHIFADVSLDIDRNFAEENGVEYIPMEYVLGDEAFYCREPESDSMMHEYYEKLRNKVKTQTSQITPTHYMDIFGPLVEKGEGILYLSLSSGLSNTYESALLAKNNLEETYDNVNIEVVDSLSATGGIGLLTESAVNNMKNGMNLLDNANWLREHSIKVQHWFKVEDLMYLKRGGRVSAATAVVGTTLNIKPILTINKEGRLDTVDKKRGNKLAYKSIIDRFNKYFDPSVSNVVYICSADCREEMEVLKKMVLEINPELTVRTTMLSPIIGAHTGPDMLCLIFYGCERE